MADENVIGRKIVAIRQMSEKEKEAEGWEDRGTTALVLDDGSVIYPSQDDEGNGSGALFGVDNKGQTIRIGYQD